MDNNEALAWLKEYADLVAEGAQTVKQAKTAIPEKRKELVKKMLEQAKQGEEILRKLYDSL